VIYVYAIAEAPAVVPTGRRVVERTGLAAIVGDEVLEPGAEELLAHERVIEELMASQPVLPARFGTTFASDAELERVLDARAEEFRELLRTVDGCVELSVRVNAEDPKPIEAVDRELGGLARASRRSGATAAAYLVPAEEVTAFAARVRQLGSEQEALDLSCTGPWPPYSFVS
jgi:hypothetical protein